MADRVGIINHGRLIALGTVPELRRQNTEAGGALEEIFLSLVDAAEKHGEQVARRDHASASAG